MTDGLSLLGAFGKNEVCHFLDIPAMFGIEFAASLTAMSRKMDEDFAEKGAGMAIRSRRHSRTIAWGDRGYGGLIIQVPSTLPNHRLGDRGYGRLVPMTPTTKCDMSKFEHQVNLKLVSSPSESGWEETEV